jgi:RimJ/RimL family protein N-acetyltransferase
VLGEAWCRLAIEVEGRFVGMTGLEEPDLSRGIARFFIVIGDRTMWKKGLGTAVARRVVEQGFRHLGLRKIVSNYFEPNVASRTVHQRVGFIDEGRLRQEAWRRGSWVDLLLVSILREQWVMESAAGALTAGASLVYSSPRNGSGSHAIRIARHGPHRRGPYRFDRGF